MFVVETGESRTPRPEEIHAESATGLAGSFVLPEGSLPAESFQASRLNLGGPYRRPGHCTSTFRRPFSTRRGRAKKDVPTLRQAERRRIRQLLFCHLFCEGDGTSACNSTLHLPCRNHSSP